MIHPVFIKEGRLIDHEHKSVAAFAEISSPQQLEQFQISEEQSDKVVVNLLDWQVSHCTSLSQCNFLWQDTLQTVTALMEKPFLDL